MADQKESLFLKAGRFEGKASGRRSVQILAALALAALIGAIILEFGAMAALPAATKALAALFSLLGR